MHDRGGLVVGRVVVASDGVLGPVGVHVRIHAFQVSLVLGAASSQREKMLVKRSRGTEAAQGNAFDCVGRGPHDAQSERNALRAGGEGAARERGRTCHTP